MINILKKKIKKSTSNGELAMWYMTTLPLIVTK